MPVPALLCLILIGQPAPPPANGPVPMPEYARAFQAGDFARAEALARARLAAQPADVQARIVAARSEAARGRFDAAYAGFRKALEIDPHSADALYYLGITAGVLAQAEYERLLALAPGSARAHQLLGLSYKAQEKTAEAEAELTAALDAGPPTADVLVALGDLSRSKLAMAEARAYYTRALALAPASYDALYGIGVCDSYAGDHAKAVSSFRQALRASPDSAPALLALGISLLQTAQPEAAVTELEHAVRLEPRMRQAYYHLGRVYRTLGRAHDAELAFAKVQQLIDEERRGAEQRLDPGPEPQ
ncbi:MAG TPA: tetratricopeptide repeat protein [Vicinamibacteria bacterium]|nr:tetratricopeptide repeat protein [Vicinamibacteria bacterium]